LQNAPRYILSETLAALILLAAPLAVGTLFLLAAYGVVLLIFRHAFGVELPDPFDWSPLDGDRGSAALNSRAELQT
jgi:hypothetical protein